MVRMKYFYLTFIFTKLWADWCCWLQQKCGGNTWPSTFHENVIFLLLADKIKRYQNSSRWYMLGLKVSFQVLPHYELLSADIKGGKTWWSEFFKRHFDQLSSPLVIVPPSSHDNWLDISSRHGRKDNIAFRGELWIAGLFNLHHNGAAI